MHARLDYHHPANCRLQTQNVSFLGTNGVHIMAYHEDKTFTSSRRYARLPEVLPVPDAVKHVVKRHVDVKTYPVTATGGTAAYVSQLFDSKTKPLCSLMKTDTGSDNPDCGLSAAYTTWSHAVTQQELYDATGHKQALRLEYLTTATLPHWENIASASKHDAAEARRADLRTAYHEAGHQSTPGALTTAIVRFADAMPATVPSDEVRAYNSAVKAFVTLFYVAMARSADERYDTATGNGLLQGAEYSSVPILKQEGHQAEDIEETPWVATDAG